METASTNEAHLCRFCAEPLSFSVVDLGEVPLANSYLGPDDLALPEPRFSLEPLLCESCWLVQLPAWESPDAIFSDYAYFSSFSDSWLDHCRRYRDSIVRRLDLDPSSQVVEIASNDGYLLQYFVESGIPVLGIEPARNVAAAAIEKGVPTRSEFFGQRLAEELEGEGIHADLLIANNVFAHVPDVNDFVAGISRLLARDGTATLEFPHLLRLLQETQFDTIYHEHYDYFSLATARRIFAAHDLEVYDVEELPTHGGSLRLYVGHQGIHPTSPRVGALLEEEETAGLETRAPYRAFRGRVEALRRHLLEFLEQTSREGRTVLAYGAPAKGNTLLCYCGIDAASIPFTVDRSPHKQNHYLPGSRIPIRSPQDLIDARPDFVLILPWNLKGEIRSQLADLEAQGTRFVVAVPDLEVLE